MATTSFFLCKKCFNTGKYLELLKPEEHEIDSSSLPCSSVEPRQTIEMFCGCVIGKQMMIEFEKRVLSGLN